MDDVLIVGGGIFGLWCARACLDLGLSVTVAERAVPGAGASATPVGALAPHDPWGWSPLKALQLAGLAALPAEIARLEAATGLVTGYRRPGRLRAVPDAASWAKAADLQELAKLHWQGNGEIRLHPRLPDQWARLISPDVAAHGVIEDTLTAQIDPPRYVGALAKDVSARGRLLLGWRAEEIEEGGARFDKGRLAASRVIVAAGWDSLALLGLARPRGVKGQAARLAAVLPKDMPVITGPKLYIVRHAGAVAVGATAEHSWPDSGPDALLDAVIARARRFCPALEDARVLERWAGIRPRAPGPGPMVGPMPDRADVWIAAGGFKIGFALAHIVGRAVAAQIAGVSPPVALPGETTVGAHLARLRRDTADEALK